MNLWSKNFKLSENDNKILHSLNERESYLIYNEIEESGLPSTMNDLNNLSQHDLINPYPIRTNVPGWVIEGIYHIVF